MKDKEKQNISMKEILTKRSIEPITNCNCKIESRIDYAVRKNEDNTGSMADLLNQEIEELQKEKQIEEMTKVICKTVNNKELKHCEVQCNVDCIGFAEALLSLIKQYQEQAVKEFAKKVKEKALSHCRTINCYELTFIETTIDELLKEYEE